MPAMSSDMRSFIWTKPPRNGTWKACGRQPGRRTQPAHTVDCVPRPLVLLASAEGADDLSGIDERTDGIGSHGQRVKREFAYDDTPTKDGPTPATMLGLKAQLGARLITIALKP